MSLQKLEPKLAIIRKIEELLHLNVLFLLTLTIDARLARLFSEH